MAIDRFRPGMKGMDVSAARVTIVDVARRAGVAISSASAALNDRPGVSEATRARVRQAANELDFVPSLRAQSLSSKRAYAVGLVIQRDSAVLEADPFFSAFIAGVEMVLPSRGYALVLQMCTSQQDSVNRYREMAANRRVDGAFLTDLEIDDPRIEQLHSLTMPTVGINAGVEESSVLAVRQDSVSAIRDAVDHLVGLGHRIIGHVGGLPQYVHSDERLQAWRDAVEQQGLMPGPFLPGDFTFEGGRRAADALLELAEPPTAVICANDLSAVGLVSRLQDRGLRVPRDMSVVGVDGISLGTYLRPTLTTVVTAPRLLGMEAARLLLAVIDGEEVRSVAIQPATLVARESTGPAPEPRQMPWVTVLSPD
jgi:DNA-binding LacI/PurR family transcriptional regulator